MKSAIVVGAAGFIGNAVTRHLLSEGIKVISVLKPGYINTMESIRMKGLCTDIVECDLKDIRTLKKKVDEDVDCFFNFAWEGTDNESIVDYKIQLLNIQWTLDAINIAKEMGCAKYVGVGAISQKELLSPTFRNYTSERHKYYRAALECSENMGRALARELGLQFSWPILINVYGEDYISRRFLNTFVHNVKNGIRMPLSSGTQLYDFLHKEDAARALCLIAETDDEEDSYIVGSGAPKPLKDYLTEARDIVNPQYDIEFNQNSAGVSLPFEYLDSSKFCERYNFSPKISFAEGIKRMVDAEDNG